MSMSQRRHGDRESAYQYLAQGLARRRHGWYYHYRRCSFVKGKVSLDPAGWHCWPCVLWGNHRDLLPSPDKTWKMGFPGGSLQGKMRLLVPLISLLSARVQDSSSDIWKSRGTSDAYA